MDINAKQKLVLKACQMNSRAINDDAELYATVWSMEGWDNSRSLVDNLKRCSRSETLSRRRRELISLGLLKTSSEAQKKREEAFKNELEAHSHKQARFL